MAGSPKRKRGGSRNPSIARVWRGSTSRENRTAYLQYLKETGLKEFSKAKGNMGTYLLARDSDGETEYMVISFWDSMKSIETFVGKDTKKPVFYPRDVEYLLRMGMTVKHYAVAEKV